MPESGLLCFVMRRYYCIGMPDLIETERHRKRQQMEGIVPRGLFMPQRKQAGFGLQWGSLEASDAMFRLGMDKGVVYFNQGEPIYLESKTQPVKEKELAQA